jgi:HEAT repeat protein
VGARTGPLHGRTRRGALARGQRGRRALGRAPDACVAFLREVVAALGFEAPAGDAATTAQGFLRAFADERAAAAAKAAAEERARRVAAAVADLASPDPHKVFSACVALGKLGDLSAAQPLVAALAHKDPYARTGALTALAALHACDAVPAVLAAVADKDEDVSQQAAAAFERITGQRLKLPEAATKRQKANAVAQGTAWWKEHEAEVRAKWGQPCAAPAPAEGAGKAAGKVPAAGRK